MDLNVEYVWWNLGYWKIVKTKHKNKKYKDINKSKWVTNVLDQIHMTP